MSLLEVEKLWISYGPLIAVENLAFNVEEGEIFGLIGPNGAGKTSIIKVLATLLKPSGGWVHFDGVDIQSRPGRVRPRIGYMPDSFGVYDDLTVVEYLQFFAAAYGIEPSKRVSIIDDVLELTDLKEKHYRRVATLSRGMKQRLSLARVLVHDPDLLLLDEPASGLDPRARIETRELLKEMKRMGKTIVVSSHILEDISQLCDSVGIVEAGRMVAQGALDDIYRQVALDRVIHAEIVNLSTVLLESLKTIAGVERIEEEADRIAIHIDEGVVAIDSLLGQMQTLGARVRMFQPQAMDLEAAFIRLTEGKTS